MTTKDYEWYIMHLTEHAGMTFTEVLFVDDVAAWCRENGIEERDKQKPLKIVTKDGVRLLIGRTVPDQVLEERINATRIRSQLTNVGRDRTDLLDSPQKKLAYLFLKELSSSNDELAYDELAADEWIFGQLHRIGVTDPSVMRAA
jgi:hypothetical protein